MAKLCTPGGQFILNAEGALWKILWKDLTTLAQTWSVLSYFKLAPTSHTSDLNMDHARLIHGLVMKMYMDPGSMISSQITQIAQSNSSRLGFPALITTLCDAKRVISDTLTFESLIPVINLAYIRKNCWNLVDPSIVFPGPWMARARATLDAPPVIPPPTVPLPVSAPPSLLSTHQASIFSYRVFIISPSIGWLCRQRLSWRV